MGVLECNIKVWEVPGSYELPLGALKMLKDQDFAPHAVVCIGTLIKGSTMHFEYICEAVTQVLMMGQHMRC
jgi:6,7-dimethyl-8-ribityllumazine synthase